MFAAIGAAVSRDAQAPPEKLELALAVTAGDALQIEVAAAGAMGAEHEADGNLGAEEAIPAFVASPRTQAKDTDGVIADAAPV